MNEAHYILKDMVMTEDSYGLVQESDTFVFKVDRRAHKIEIRNAVEKAFGVRVLSVNTCITSSYKKNIRGRAGQKSVIRGFKKAFVRVHHDDISKIPLI